jgi:hypothetical protein
LDVQDLRSRTFFFALFYAFPGISAISKASKRKNSLRGFCRIEPTHGIENGHLQIKDGHKKTGYTPVQPATTNYNPMNIFFEEAKKKSVWLSNHSV